MKKAFIILFSLFLLLPLATPAVVQAESCDCYCTQVEMGVKTYSEKVGTASSSNECMATCGALSNKVYFACTGGQTTSTPEANVLCWTENECTGTPAADVNGDVMTEVSSDGVVRELFNQWGDENPQCSAGYGYCYAPPEKIKFGMPIGELTEAGDIGTYIDAFYSWLLPAAGILAIVLIMIGGFQWAMARGDAGAVKKAKDRIIQAVFGLILLMAAYTIAYLVDPRLTTFESLRIPLVKTVTFLDEDSTCESIEASLGVGSVTPLLAGQESCGDIGIVSFESSGGTVITGLESGDRCTYGACSNLFESCLLTDPTGESYTCVACSEVYEGGEYGGQTPSDYTCGRFVTEAVKQRGERTETSYQCNYYESSIFETTSCASLEYPEGSPGINCELLRQDAAAAGSVSCRAYDLVVARYAGESTEEIDDLYDTNISYPLLNNLCYDDPCGLAQNGDHCTVMAWTGISAKLAGTIGLLVPGVNVMIVSYNVTATAGEAVDLNQGGYFSHVDCVDVDAPENGYITGVRADGSIGEVDWQTNW